MKESQNSTFYKKVGTLKFANFSLEIATL